MTNQCNKEAYMKYLYFCLPTNFCGEIFFSPKLVFFAKFFFFGVTICIGQDFWCFAHTGFLEIKLVKLKTQCNILVYSQLDS